MLRIDIVGWFHIKDLTLIDPDDEMGVIRLLNLYKHHVAYCYTTDSLFDMLLEFRNGSTHVAFVLDVVQNDVRQDPYEQCVGILTFHDVIESLLQYNINDEYDQFYVASSEMRSAAQLNTAASRPNTTTTTVSSSAYGINYLRNLISQSTGRKSQLSLMEEGPLLERHASFTSSSASSSTLDLQTKLITLQILTSI